MAISYILATALCQLVVHDLVVSMDVSDGLRRCYVVIIFPALAVYLSRHICPEILI